MLAATTTITMCENDGIPRLQAALGRARAVFSTRIGGGSPPPLDSMNLAPHLEADPSIAERNRVLFCASLERRPGDVALCSQVHGTALLVATPDALETGDRAQAHALGEADALLRTGPSPCLAVQVADCAPVIVADPETGAGAAVHAGWRGAAAGIIERAVAALEQLTRRRRSEFMAAIGPCVRSTSYEVGPEVFDAFEHWGKARDGVLRRAGGSLSLDLGMAAYVALQRAGVAEAMIIDSGACTFSRADLFYSHRRDRSQTGRMWGMLL